MAVKFLLPQVCADTRVIVRFLREAQAAVRIQSEHVARVIDVGTLETGAPYMVMEYLVGSDLAHLLRARGPLPIEEAVDYVLQACEAIAEAHARGIVHRDLKPANLFLVQRLDGSPLVKVLDFGISKSTNADGDGMSQPSMTATSAILGSPQYMSPEQMRSSKNVDGRTDIWALGAILYELLTGHVVYQAETLPGLIAMIASDPTPPLRGWQGRPDAPAELEEVLMKCLAKDPAQRIPNVAALATALLPFAPKSSRLSVERIVRVIQGAGLSVSALALPPSTSPTPPVTGPVQTAGSWVQPAPPAANKRVRVIVVVASALVGAVIGTGAVMLKLSHSSGKTPAASSLVPDTSSHPSVTTSVSAPVLPAASAAAATAPSAEPAASVVASAVPPSTASAKHVVSRLGVPGVPPKPTSKPGGFEGQY